MAPDDDSRDNNSKGSGPWGSRNQNNGQQNNGPWGQKPQGQGPRNEDAPDLDTVIRNAQDRFKGAFRGGKPPAGNPFSSGKSIGFVFLLILVLWLATGFYRVQPQENAVILTFGKWSSTRGEPGLGYALPYPIQQVVAVDVALDRKVTVGFSDASNRMAAKDLASESMMLTGDENIIDIDFVVLWKVSDAGKYLFKIREPEATIKKVAESSMREIVGRTPIQKALTESRADVETKTRDLMQKVLDEYQSGIAINNVQLQKVNPPAQVVDAFDDVQRARADKERMKNEAETYRNDIVPKARGEAQKMIQEAEAYKQAVTSKAQGDADRFTSVYKAYAEAKDVTQKRIYIETMQQILQSSKKIIVGDDQSVLPYLPLDRLNSSAAAARPAPQP